MKQETIKEVAERLYPIKIESCIEGKIDVNSYERNLFIQGAKWQEAISYNEEDMRESFVKGALTDLRNTWDISNEDMAIEKFKEWFGKFKKK